MTVSASLRSCGFQSPHAPAGVFHGPGNDPTPETRPAHRPMMTTAPLDFRSGWAERFSIMDIRTTPKVPSAETGGQFSMVEQAVEPGAESPLQISHKETKVFYVVSGAFEFLLGGITRQATPGDTVVIPTGASHRFRNVGPAPGTLFVTFTPGGHEDFLRELSDLFQGEIILSEELQAICEKYGVEML